MRSFLIISENTDDSLSEAEKICQEHTISLHDITLFDPSRFEGKSPKKSWGIEDIRQLQKLVYLKPLKGKEKAVMIKEADLLTPEAQNALLKVLEEPPEGTFLFLLGTSLSNFLPTIISRCKIITLATHRLIANEEIEKVQAELAYLLKAPTPDRLKKAESLTKNKDDAVIWLTTALFAIHEAFQTKPSLHLAEVLRRISFAHKVIKTTNTNPRLTLEHLFLNI